MTFQYNDHALLIRPGFSLVRSDPLCPDQETLIRPLRSTHARIRFIGSTTTTASGSILRTTFPWIGVHFPGCEFSCGLECDNFPSKGANAQLKRRLTLGTRLIENAFLSMAPPAWTWMGHLYLGGNHGGKGLGCILHGSPTEGMHV